MNTLTVEEIAAGGGIFEGRYAQTLAREIIALREFTQVLCREGGEIRDRLDTLESQARPLQESGELAVGECDCNAAGIMLDLDAAYADLDKVKAERDAAIARADEAERERTEMERQRDLARDGLAQWKKDRDELNEYRQACLDWQDSWHRVIVERDASRDALRKYGRHHQAMGMLGVPATCDFYSSQPCTCGLTEALDGSGQHE